MRFLGRRLRSLTHIAASKLLMLVGVCVLFDGRVNAAVERADASDPMVLGAAAPAPLGYLRFCARRPDQCGLDVGSATSMDAGERERRLVAKYYWAVAFHSASLGSVRLAPTFGKPERVQPADGVQPPSHTSTSQTELSLASPGMAPREPETGEVTAPAPATDAFLALLTDVNKHVNRSIRYMSDIKQYGVEDYWTLPLDRGGHAAGDCKDYVLEKRRALMAQGVASDDLSIAIVRTPMGETHAVLLVATERGELVLDSLSSRIVPWQDTSYIWIERQAPGHPLAWVTIKSGRRRS